MKVPQEDARWDVIVCGAGPAGIVAALASARHGARTLLVEQLPVVGGMAGTGLGWLGFYDNAGRRVVGGLPWSIVQRLLDTDSASVRRWTGASDDEWFESSTLRVDPEAVKRVATTMLEEAGVEILVRTSVVGLSSEEAGLHAIRINNKSGAQTVYATRVIDCTGDGDLAAMAGAEFEIGRRGDGITQPMTMIFALVGVDLDEAVRSGVGWEAPWEEVAPRRGSRRNRSVQIDFSRWGSEISALLPNGVPRMWVHDHGDGMFYTGNFAHIGLLNGANGGQLSAGEIEGRKFVWSFVDFLRACVPGFDSARIANVATHIGVRETRRVHGQYWITYEDAVRARQFADSVAQSGNMLDVHHAVKGEFERLPLGSQIDGFGSFGIPFGALVPRGVDGMLMAGRCVSGEREAQASFRVMGTCMAMGQAAGTAAAISVSQRREPAELDTVDLRRVLRQDGAIVDASDAAPASEFNGAPAELGLTAAYNEP